LKTYRWRDAIAAAPQSLSANARLIAYTLANHMDKDGGSCFPSHATLAREANVAERTVRRGLVELRRAGYVVTPTWLKRPSPRDRSTWLREPWDPKGERGFGRGWVLEYVATTPNESRSHSPASLEQKSVTESGFSTAEPGQFGHEKPVTVAVKYVQGGTPSESPTLSTDFKGRASAENGLAPDDSNHGDAGSAPSSEPATTNTKSTHDRPRSTP